MAFLALTVLTGMAYPLLVAGLAWTTFPKQAAGSLLRKDGRVVGSMLIEQVFTDPGDFWGRPSATVGADG
jgi:K+-transporting ATPase ATPase C chain